MKFYLIQHTSVGNGPYCYHNFQKLFAVPIFPLTLPITALLNYLGAMPLSTIKLPFEKDYLSPLLDSLP